MADKKHKHKIGDIWLNPISGLEYAWDGKQWVSTGKYPYGSNPMGFLGDGTQDGPPRP
jgi:hypothetical protein